MDYGLPPALRDLAKGKRVAIVNDVINAGSAIRGTLEQFQEWDLEAAGSLLTLGPAAEELTQKHELELITLASMHNPIWEPFACPLGFAWKPLEHTLAAPNRNGARLSNATPRDDEFSQVPDPGGVAACQLALRSLRDLYLTRGDRKFE